MREVHRELQDLKGTVNPLEELGKRIARRFPADLLRRVPCSDVTDAMILHRCSKRCSPTASASSPPATFHPTRLSERLHRDRILPAIELLRTARGDQRRCRSRLPPAFTASRSRCTTGRWASSRPAHALDFDSWPKRATKTACCTSSTASCTPADGGRRGVVRLQDAVRRPAFAERLPRDRARFHTCMLSDVPQMPPRLASEAGASHGLWTCCMTAGSADHLGRRAAQELYTEGAGARDPRRCRD
jgi:cell division protein ZapE